VYDVGTGEEKRVVTHSRWVRAVAVSPDSRRILAACSDRAARLFDAANGALEHRWEHGSWVRRCPISPDGTLGVTVGGDQQARLLRLGGAREELARFDHQHRLRACAIDPLGAYFATGRANGSLRVYSFDRTLQRSFELGSEIWTLAFTVSGSHLLAGCHDGGVHLAHIESGRVDTLARLSGWVRASACSPTVLLVGSRQGLSCWDAVTLETRPLSPALTPELECRSVTFSPDGTRLLTAWADSIVRCHEWPSATEIAAIPHPGWSWTCEFFATGTRIVTGCDDGRLRVFDVKPDRDPELLLTVACAFVLPHAQSATGYFTLPAGASQRGFDVVCDGASYPLSLLAPILDRPDLVAASMRGENPPSVNAALAAAFDPVRLPHGWPEP
jgi:WD40 repeat protein